MHADHAIFCEFLEWLTARQGETMPAANAGFSIALHTPAINAGAETLASRLIEYLNSFDPVCAGYWRAFHLKTLEQIVQSTGGRASGIASERSQGTETSAQQDLQRLVRRLTTLRAVVLVNAPTELTRRQTRTFHVGVLGDRQTRPASSFHLTVKASQFPGTSLPRVIADAALEWAFSDFEDSARISPITS